MADAGKITAIIDGDISGLTNALNQARGQATTAVSGIEGSFKGGLKAGLSDVTSGMTFYDKNSTAQHPIASISKLMSALVFLDFNNIVSICNENRTF